MTEHFSASIRTAFHSLRLHKLRSILSIVGVVCGVSTVLAILAIGAGAEAETMRRIGRLGLANIYLRADNLSDEQLSRARRFHSRGLQASDLERLQTTGLPIRRTAAIREQRADPVGFPDGLAPRVVEATRDYLAILGLRLATGRFLADRDLADANRVCVLGWSVARSLGVDGRPGAILRMGTELWQVVGVIARQGDDPLEAGRISLQDIDNMIIVPLGTMARSDGVEPVSELIIELRSAERIEDSLAVLVNTVRAAHNGVDDFSVIVPHQLLAQARTMQRLFGVVFGAIGGLSLVIGGIGIMNVMLAGISERVREIGLRRAVGARPGHIVVQFLSEAMLLTTCGGILGLAGGAALASAVSWYAGWPVLFSPLTVVLPLAMALTTGCLFGLYPAVKAARMDPLQALGYGA